MAVKKKKKAAKKAAKKQTKKTAKRTVKKAVTRKSRSKIEATPKRKRRTKAEIEAQLGAEAPAQRASVTDDSREMAFDFVDTLTSKSVLEQVASIECGYVELAIARPANTAPRVELPDDLSEALVRLPNGDFASLSDFVNLGIERVGILTVDESNTTFEELNGEYDYFKVRLLRIFDVHYSIDPLVRFSLTAKILRDIFETAEGLKEYTGFSQLQHSLALHIDERHEKLEAAAREQRRIAFLAKMLASVDLSREELPGFIPSGLDQRELLEKEFSDFLCEDDESERSALQ